MRRTPELDSSCQIDSRDLWALLDSLAVENDALASAWEADCIQAYAFGQSQLIGALCRWLKEREVEAHLSKAEEN